MSVINASPVSADVGRNYSKNLEDLLERFNGDKGKVRLVTLLSPTCPACVIRGTSILRAKVLGEIESDDLRIYAVWVPSLRADNEGRVPAATSRLADKRVRHYWDERGELRRAYQRVMNRDEPAWDVYYVYDRDAEWKMEPPVPEFDMHQLNSMPTERKLDGDQLAAEINRLL